jgi:hypothetical protein
MSTHPGPGGRDRAVSDVVGFVFVFAMIVGSTAIVFTVGVDTLGDYRSGVQMDNAEGTMVSLGDALASVDSAESPGRTVQMRLYDGGLAVTNRNDTRIHVTVTVDGPDGPATETLSPGTLAYRKDGRAVAYQGGGVFRGTAGSAVAVAPPAVRCRGSVAIVSVVSVQATGPTGVTGSVAEVSVTRDRTRLLTSTDRAAETRLSVDSRYGDAWARRLAAAGWTDPDGDGTYACAASRVVVRETVVDVRLSA